MATVEEKASPEAAEAPGAERYTYVIEKPASDEYRNVQAERAEALEKMFEGKSDLPKPFLDDVDGGRFFLKGRDRQRSGEVKSLIPERYFGDGGVRTREVVYVLLRSLREGKPLKEVVEESWGDKKKLVALKLVGARLLQEHHPETLGKEWREMDEEERRTVRVAEMMVHAAEMGALKRRIDNDDLDEDTARVFEKNYSHYAKNVDIPQEQRREYQETAKLLREELDLTPKAGAKVAESEEVLGGEKRVPLERETEVGRAGEETVVERRRPAVAAGEYPEKDEFERKVREHERALGEKTEGLSVFDMNEAQVRQRMTYLKGKMGERRGSEDPRVRRAQEIVDGNVSLPAGEAEKLGEQAVGQWREQSLEYIDRLVDREAAVAKEQDKGKGKRLGRYADMWLNELGREEVEEGGGWLDKAAGWVERAYARLKAGGPAKQAAARGELVAALRRAAEREDVSRDASLVAGSLADRFELMNLRERLKDVERLKPLRKRGTKKKQGGV